MWESNSQSRAKLPSSYISSYIIGTSIYLEKEGEREREGEKREGEEKLEQKDRINLAMNNSRTPASASSS